MVVFKVLREFAVGTSIHGFSFLESPKSSSRTKIIWAIAIVVALSYASWEMRNSVISKYYCVFKTMKNRLLIIITYVQIHLLKFEFELVINEKIAPVCLVINKDIRFTTIAFLQVVFSTVYSQTAFLVHNPFIYRFKMDFNHKQSSSICQR